VLQERPELPSFVSFHNFSPRLTASLRLFIFSVLIGLTFIFTPQGFAAQGFAAQGFAAQGFAAQGFAAQGFAAQGLHGLEAFPASAYVGIAINAAIINKAK
jgi:hypothetical protein